MNKMAYGKIQSSISTRTNVNIIPKYNRLVYTWHAANT